MKKYTEEEIKEHLRAIEVAMQTGSTEHIELFSSATERWESFGSVVANFCLARTKPAPKIVPFDVSDAPLMVTIRKRRENADRQWVVTGKDKHGISFLNSQAQSHTRSYSEACEYFEFTRDGETWQPYGRKEGV